VYRLNFRRGINTKEEVYAYLEAALEENDTEALFGVIGAIACLDNNLQV